MLAIFQKSFANPLEELRSPKSTRNPKSPQEILQDFISRNPSNAFSMGFGRSAVLAYSRPDSPYSTHQRLFCGLDDIYCLFLGNLHNLCALNRQYGLSKVSNEAMFVIEAYRTLRDRGPYPADKVIRDLEGSFAFIIYDCKNGTVFTSLSSDGGVKLYWGMAADGSVVISDELDIIKAGCAKSFAPFPTGCMFHSEGGLMSFEHPMNKIKAMPRIDSEGVLCGANFKVDAYTRVQSIPRRGSEANWSLADSY